MSKTAISLSNELIQLAKNNPDISRFTPEYIDQIASGEIDRKYCKLNSSNASLIKLTKLTRQSNHLNYSKFPHAFNPDRKISSYSLPGEKPQNPFWSYLRTFNLCVCGGSFSVESPKKVNDYDLFLVNYNPNKIPLQELFIETINKITVTLLFTKFNLHKISYNANAITFVTSLKGTDYVFQLILKRFNTIAEVLYSFDLPVSQIAYDGVYYYLTDGAFLTYTTNVLPVIFDKMCNSFVFRLQKYYERGFSLWFSDIEVNNLAIYYKCEHFTMTRTNFNKSDNSAYYRFEINLKKISNYELYSSYGPLKTIDYMSNQSLYELNEHISKQRNHYHLLYDEKIMKEKITQFNFDLKKWPSFKLVKYVKTLPLLELMNPTEYSEFTYLVDGEKNILKEEPTDSLLLNKNKFSHYQNLYIKLLSKIKFVYDLIEHQDGETLEEVIKKIDDFSLKNPKYHDLITSIYKYVRMLKNGTIYLIRDEKEFKLNVDENITQEDILVGYSIVKTKLTKEDFNFAEEIIEIFN